MYEEENIESDYTEEELELIIANFVERGLLTPHWDEKLQETLYQVNEIAKVEEPALWEMHIKDLQRGIYRMWQEDFVSLTFSEDGFEHDSVKLTDKVLDDEAVSKLSEDDQRYIDQLKKAFERE